MTTTWNATVGCGALAGQVDPYETYTIEGRAGSIVDQPPDAGDQHATAEYSIVVGDGVGNEAASAATADVPGGCG